MTKLYTTEAAGAYGVTPPTKTPGNTVQAGLKRIRGTYVSTGANNAAGDTIVIGRMPVGAVFAGGEITQSVSSGTTTVAIGNSTTAGKYRAAAVQATVDQPIAFGTAASVAQAALAAEEEVIATLAVGALPAGTYVFDLYYSSAS